MSKKQAQLLRAEGLVDRVLASVRGEGGAQFKSLMSTYFKRSEMMKIIDKAEEHLVVEDVDEDTTRDLAERLHVKIIEARSQLNLMSA